MLRNLVCLIWRGRFSGRFSARAYRRNLSDTPQLAAVGGFIYTYGGCTTVFGLSGHYLSDLGLTVQDQVSLLYTDASLALDENRATWTRYAGRLHQAAVQALDEEAVLIVVFGVHHAGQGVSSVSEPGTLPLLGLGLGGVTLAARRRRRA